MSIIVRLRGFGFALLMLVLGVAVTALPLIRDSPGTPAIVIFFAIVLSAWYGGLWPGLLATGLVALLTFTAPFTPWRAVRLALFLACGGSISVLAEILHAARRRAEESRRSLSSVLASIGDAVIATDAQGRVTFANQVAGSLTGWPPDEAAGKRLAEVFRAIDETTRQSLEDPASRALRDGAAVRSASHTVLIARDGAERPICDGASPIRDAAGKLVGAVLVFRDDTERREYERGLLDSGRRKDEFLAMLAHELRNPLGAIKAAVSALGTPGDEDHLAWGRDVLNRQVDQLSRLLDDLLDVARIARGRVALRKELIDVAEVIRHSVESVRHLLEGRGHQLEMAVSPGMGQLEADPVRLEQVLVNLLANAAQYTPPGGTIRISASCAGDRVVIRVEDNGPGISRERLPTIFESFAQGERTLGRHEGGLGIGLTIVKGLVELHGGSVTARSARPGLGSVFTVSLPAYGGQAPRVDPPLAPQVVTKPTVGDSRRILIIDDNMDLARGLERLLEHRGHEVRTAHDGPEGIEAAISFVPDVLLLDIGLPNLDGYEVARRLRHEEDLGRSLIIAMSGYAQDEDRRRSYEAGIDHHLAKPVDIETIVGLIARPDGAICGVRGRDDLAGH
jgi:PAS domain S-box-containing protein